MLNRLNPLQQPRQRPRRAAAAAGRRWRPRQCDEWRLSTTLISIRFKGQVHTHRFPIRLSIQSLIQFIHNSFQGKMGGCSRKTCLTSSSREDRRNKHRWSLRNVGFCNLKIFPHFLLARCCPVCIVNAGMVNELNLHVGRLRDYTCKVLTSPFQRIDRATYPHDQPLHDKYP